MDNKYDEIDNVISEYFKNSQNIPPIIEQGIRSALYTEKASKFYIIETIRKTIRKIIITITTLLTVGGGIVFANEIGQWLDNIFNDRSGTTSAIDNGYISSPQMEYIESNKIDVKVENILMDDYNLNIKFNIRFNEKDIKEINDIELAKMIIYDENSNILYCNNEELFNKWASKNNINFKMYDFSEKNINSGLNYHISEKILKNNQLSVIYNLSSYNLPYPKSKSVNLNIAGIAFEIDFAKKYAEGSWNMELDVPEKFFMREAILFNQKETSDERIEIIEAYAYDTGFNFKLKVEEKQKQQVIDENELWNKMEQEYIEYNNKQQDECIEGEHHYIGEVTEQYMIDFEKMTQPLKNIYIENENGQKFYITKSTSENGVVDRTSNENYFTYTDTFDITKYDITNILKIYFQYEGLNKVIILEKK